jgi:hypothetical protein
VLDRKENMMHAKFVIGAAAVAALLVVGLAEASVARVSAPAAAVEARSLTVREYRARATQICTSAHARLNIELLLDGVELVSAPKAPHPWLSLHPVDEEGLRAYDRAARRVLGETLPKLRSVDPPRAVRAAFTSYYRLMVQFVDAKEAPRAFWIHEVERERSLRQCTFSLGR